MTDDPDNWRSDRTIARWVSLFFEEMRWALDEMAQGVPDVVLEELEADKRAQKDKTAAAAARIPSDGSARSTQLADARARLDGEIDAVDSPRGLADATERVVSFENAVNSAVETEARRVAAMAELAKVKNSPDFISEKRRDFADRKKVLSAEITAGMDVQTFDRIDARIQELSDEIVEQKKVVAARDTAEKAMIAARERATGLAKKLDRGALLHINGKFAGILKDLGKADDLAKFTKVKTNCDAFMVLAGQAETYGAYFDMWFKTSAALIATVAVDKPLSRNKRNAAMAAATVESEKGNFGPAKTALEVFNAQAGDGGVGGTADFDATAAFIVLVEQLEASHGDKLAEVAASKLKGVNSKKKAIADIRKQGVANGDVAGATGKIDPLKAWIDGNIPLARKMDEFHPAAGQIPEYSAKLQEMEVLRTAEKWGGALTKMNELTDPGDLADQVASISVDRKLKASYEALHARASGKAKTGLKTAWDAHHAAAIADPKVPATMKSTLATLMDWMQLDEIYDEREKVKAIFAGHPKAKDYGGTDAVTTLFNKQDFTGALAAIKLLGPLLETLCDYLDARQDAGLLLLALPADPTDLRDLVQQALDDTDAKAKNGDPQGALDDLQATIDGEGLQIIALAISDYQQRIKPVDKEHDFTLSFMEHSEPKKVLNDSLDAVKALASPACMFDEAFNALVVHQALLKTAMDYAARRLEAQKTLDSLGRAIKQDALWEAKMFTVGKSYATLTAAFANAEADAKKSKFKEATAAYKVIIVDCTAAMKKAVDLYEASDEVDSNAGHSRDSHGSQMTEADHLTRLTTGMAPGGRDSKTNTSSSFHSDSDWLAGREIGAQKAAAAGVNVADTSIPWPSAEPVAQKFVIDHGRPIDIAFRGVRQKQTYDPGSDEFKDTGTYETYEVLTGLTRALVNFTWECDTLNGAKPRELQDYADAYAAANGNAQPASIPGRWVMMQQFPWAEDWNQAEQRYNKPIT